MRKCAFGRFAVWTLAVATGLIGAGFFLGYGSHIKTAWKEARKAVSRQVPPDFEIARLRNELNNIDKDIANSFDALARETVQVKHLKDEVAGMKTRLDDEKKVVLALRHEVDSGNKRVSYSGVDYTTEELRTLLTRRFDGYKRAEEALKAKEEELKARVMARDAGRDKIDAMRSAKEQLTAELAKIEAEYKRLQVVETKSPFQVDDSRLSSIKNSMKELRDRVDEQILAHDYKAEFNTSLAEKVEQKVKSEEVLKEIDKHFGTTPDKVVEK
jgi:chromosome segregation ATPase